MVALGGSITAGQGVAERQDGYISRLYRWIQACLLCSLQGPLNHLWPCCHATEIHRKRIQSFVALG